MPCRDDWSDRSSHDPHADTKARLACMYCHELVESGKDVPRWAKSWWKHHAEFDKKRIEEELEEARKERIRNRMIKEKKAEILKKISTEDLKFLKENM